MSLVSQHHSFDIHLASEYGLEEALLIHHFQHWIRVNRTLNRNVKEGRCWTYQTKKEICAHYPYFTYKQIRTILDRLVDKGVLIRANFNKNKMDQTLWYAFADEEKFGVSDEIQKSLTKAQMGHSLAQTGQPIPYTKTICLKETTTLPPPKGAPPGGVRDGGGFSSKEKEEMEEKASEFGLEIRADTASWLCKNLTTEEADEALRRAANTEDRKSDDAVVRHWAMNPEDWDEDGGAKEAQDIENAIEKMKPLDGKTLSGHQFYVNLTYVEFVCGPMMCQVFYVESPSFISDIVKFASNRKIKEILDLNLHQNVSKMPHNQRSGV